MAAYFVALSLGFFSDDYLIFWLIEFEGIEAIGDNFNDDFFIPLSHLFSYVTYSISSNPIIHHTIQLLLHAACAWQLYLLILALFPNHDKRYWLAVITSLIFLLHPYQTEAVVWVSARSYLLCFLFAIMAIRKLVQAQVGCKKSLLLVGIYLAISIHFKEMGYAFGLISIAYVLMYRIDKKLYGLGLLATLTVCLVLRFIVLGNLVGGYGSDTHIIDFSNALTNMGAYGLKLSGFFRYQSELLGLSLQSNIIISCLIVLISAVIVFIRVRKNKALFQHLIFWTICFTALLIPILSLEITSLNSMESDRYSYCVMAVVAFGLAWLLSSNIPALSYTITISILLMLTLLVQQNMLKWHQANLQKAQFDSYWIQSGFTKGHLLIEGVPDNLDGVYMYRNGLREQLQIEGLINHKFDVCIITDAQKNVDCKGYYIRKIVVQKLDQGYSVTEQ